MKLPPKWPWNKWRWPLVFLVLLFVSSSLVGKYFPWFMAQVWYLRHRNGVTFMGKVIPVPRGMMGPWKTLPGRDSVSFDRFSPTMHGDKGQIEWGMYFSRDLLRYQTTQDAVKRLGMNLSVMAERMGHGPRTRYRS